MRIDMRGKIVLITGASSGIGAKAAALLAERGAIPVLTARSADKMARLAGNIRGQSAVYEMDVRSDEQVRGTVEQVVERFGRIDVLLNNAGYGEFVSFGEAPIGHFRDMMDVNYLGVVRCTLAVLPHMKKAGTGHVVNVASMAGKLATAKSTAYSATKHAVLGFTNALRQELKGSGIAVSAVNPGPIDTPFFERADPDGQYVRNVRWFMMSPDKVARSIVTVIETRRAELDLPWTAAAGTKFMQLFPRIGDALFGKLTNRK